MGGPRHTLGIVKLPSSICNISFRCPLSAITADRLARTTTRVNRAIVSSDFDVSQT
jgi:hypothetical protein